jgi:hypothetical protein
MFPKDADHGALKDRLLVENGGCNVLDSLSKAQELRLPVGGEGAFATNQVVHSSAADLTFFLYGPYIRGRVKRRVDLSAFWEPVQSAADFVRWKGRSMIYLASIIAC